jgi:hypothetical protein
MQLKKSIEDEKDARKRMRDAYKLAYQNDLGNAKRMNMREDDDLETIIHNSQMLRQKEAHRLKMQNADEVYEQKQKWKYTPKDDMDLSL